MTADDRVPALAQTIARADRRFVWLDSIRYVRRLFARDENLWANPTRFVDVVRRGQRLLGSDVIEIGLDAFHRSTPPAASEPAKRPTAALRRVLADTGPTDRAAESARALASMFPQTPIVIVVGGARRWLSFATGADETEWDDDAIDGASVHLAECVRGFAAAGAAGVVIDLRGLDGARAAADARLHEPLANVAAHYGWTTALLVDAQPPAGDLPEAHVVLCTHLDAPPAPGAPPIVGGGLDARFWLAGEAQPLRDRGLFYGEIPEDAEPERVLAAIARLRSI